MKIQIKSSEVLILLITAAMSFLANLPDSILGSLVDRTTLLIVLAALTLIAMLRYLQMVLLLAILILVIGANLPAELASVFGVSQLVLLVSLSVIIMILLINHVTKLLPMGKGIESTLPVISRQYLMKTITEGDMATLKHLMSMNVDVNFIEDGMTPLHLAAEQGKIEIVRLLIAQGADYRKKNAEGKSLSEILIKKNRLTQVRGMQDNANKTLFTYAQVETQRRDSESWRNQLV